MKQQIVFLCLILAIGVKAASVPQIESFIINGVPATSSPSYAHVVSSNAAGTMFPNSGGSIISLTHILTAGNAIVGFVNWNVGVGSITTAGLARHISTVAVAHPQYIETPRANDIGIITLQVALALTANIQPIGLPQIGQVVPFEYEQGRVYGTGATMVGGLQSPTVQVAYQRVTNITDCVATVPNAATAQQFCARDLTRNSNICVGDVGGGLIIPYRGVDLLVGIASSIAVNCNTALPVPYSRVSHYRTWIRMTTGI